MLGFAASEVDMNSIDWWCFATFVEAISLKMGRCVSIAGHVNPVSVYCDGVRCHALCLYTVTGWDVMCLYTGMSCPVFVYCDRVGCHILCLHRDVGCHVLFLYTVTGWGVRSCVCIL